VVACTAPSGYVANDGDCDDTDGSVHAESVWYTDADRDGYGDASTAASACTPTASQVANADDCDDTDRAVWEESEWFDDIDGDGYGSSTSGSFVCHPDASQVDNGDDCNDVNRYISPGATETCNDVEDDCDGLTDDADSDLDTSTGTEWSLDTDSDGYWGDTYTVWACDKPSGAATLASANDCDDDDSSVNPGKAEICGDGVDQDCDDDAGECGIGDASSADYAAKYKGITSLDALGASVGIGDIDGDGTNDLAAGAQLATNGAYSAGGIYAFDTWTGTSVSASTATQDFISPASSAYDFSYFGSVMALGDLNRDGDIDILGGGYDYNSGRGIAVWYTPGSTWSATSYTSFSGGSTNDYCGWAVATGDVTGDGNTDAIVSCPGESGGSVYIYQRTTASYEISRTDTTNYQNYGTSIAVADVTGDGQDDMLVGASWGDQLFLNEGPITASGSYSSIYDETRTLSGSGDYVHAVGDVTNDGYDDMLLYVAYGSYLLEGGTGSVLAGASYFGVDTTSACGGDFNDDGIQDLAIGYTDYDSYKGEAIIDYGPVGSMMASDAVISGVSSDYLGSSIAAGDLDNDGIDDLAIGAYNNSEGGTGAGAVYVFLGGGI
jgi:hypothetical protein